MKEFIGDILNRTKEQYGYKMNRGHLHHHCQDNKQYGDYSRHHQAAAVHHEQDPGLVRRGQNSSHSSSFCLPPLALPLLRDDKSVLKRLGRPPPADRLASPRLWPF